MRTTLTLQIVGSVDGITKALVAASSATMPTEDCPRDAGTSGGAADTTKG